MKKQTKTQTTQACSLKREKRRVVLLSIGGFFASSAPLAVLLILRWERYVSVPAGGLRLCLGGGIIALLLLLKVLGRLHLPSRITLMAVALTMTYLLEAVLSDLSLILWAALIGEALDAFLFSPMLKRARERVAQLRGADATAGAVEELLKKYVGGGKSV